MSIEDQIQTSIKSVIQPLQDQLDRIERKLSGLIANQAINNDAELLTVTEAAKALKVSRSTIYRMFESGELPYVKPTNGTTRTRRDAIERLAKEGCSG